MNFGGIVLREKLSYFFKDKVEPGIHKFDNNIYISNFRDVITSFGFPLALTGSIFYIVANPPRGTDSSFFKLWLSCAVQIREQLMIPYYFTAGMVSVVTAFMLAYRLSRCFNLKPPVSGLVSALSFLTLCFSGGASNTFTLESISKVTGPNGIFIAFLVSIATVKLLAFFETKRLYFDIKSELCPAVSEAFRNMFPIMVIVPVMWIVGWFVGQFFGEPLPSGITTTLGNMISLSSNLIRDITGSIVTSVLYFTGMDGGMIKQPVYNVFLNLGGFGTLLPLTILFMLSYSKQLRKIGSVILIPGLFNIPYPIIFAVPVILNPVYLVPFLIYPVISTVINHFILSSGILTVTVEATCTMPVILSGYFSTAGQVVGILLQIFNLMLAGLVYYPFFRYHESKLLKEYGTKEQVIISVNPFKFRLKKYLILMSNKFQPKTLRKKGRSVIK